MKVWLAATILAAACASADANPPPDAETGAAAEPVLAAIKRDYRIQAAQHRLAAARHALQEAEAGMFPNLTFDARQGYRENRDYDRAFDPALSGAERQIALRATHNLNLHGRRDARIRAARAFLDETGHRLRLSAHDVIAETARTQVEAHHAAQLVRAQQKLVDLLRRAIDESEELLRFDQVDKTAVSRARHEILAASADLSRFRAEQLSANARLLQLSGLTETSSSLPALLDHGAESVANKLEYDLGIVPVVAIAQALLDQAAARHDVARAEFMPRWSIEASTSQRQFNRERERDTSVHASVTFTIFDGGAHHARARETLRDLDAAHSSLKHTKTDTLQRANELHRRRRLLGQLEDGLQDSLRLAAENLQAALELDDLHRLPSVRLLHARADLVRAQIRLDDNRRQMHLASIDLLHATGALARAAGLQPLYPSKIAP